MMQHVSSVISSWAAEVMTYELESLPFLQPRSVQTRATRVYSQRDLHQHTQLGTYNNAHSHKLLRYLEQIVKKHCQIDAS